MSTKEEIIQEIESSQNVKSVSLFYQFDEGKQIFLDRPEQNLKQIDQSIIDCLINGTAESNPFALTSLLYYRTFAHLTPEQYQGVTGSIYFDKNLYSEETKDSAKTGASAAYCHQNNDIYLREKFLSGSPETLALDIISILHETKHYLQHIENPPFVRHMNGTDEGQYSQHDLLAKAFRGFTPYQLLPNADIKQIGLYSFSLYHQNPIEIEARDYSLQIAHDLISQALSTENLPPERVEYLTSMLSTVKTYKDQNYVETSRQGILYGRIQKKVEERAQETLAKKDEILTPENIAILKDYSEYFKEAENLRSFLFDIESALFVQYDESAAKTVEDIVLNYDVFGVGRSLVQNPNYTPTQEVIDKIIGDNGFIRLGVNPIPCYPMEEVVERYAELNATESQDTTASQ